MPERRSAPHVLAECTQGDPVAVEQPAEPAIAEPHDVPQRTVVQGAAGIEVAERIVRMNGARGRKRLRPIGSIGHLFGGRQTVQADAQELGVTAAQVLLAWATRPAAKGRRDVVAILKALRPAHVAANAAALQLELSNDVLARLEAACPAPSTKTALDIV